MKNRPSEGTIYILGVRVDNVTHRTAFEMVKAYASHRSGNARKVFFTNVHTIQSARRDGELRSCINAADLVLPDGSGLAIAGKVARTPIHENLNGTDFTPGVLRFAESEGLTVYLLGARAPVVEGCIDRLRSGYPELRISGYHHGYFGREEEEAVLGEISGRRPDILLVAMGTPEQEKWITRNASRLNTGVCLGVGGLFDFLSGAAARAPFWMRRLGLEWLHRFLRDPRSKWERVLVEIPVFLTLVIASRARSAGRLVFR